MADVDGLEAALALALDGIGANAGAEYFRRLAAHVRAEDPGVVAAYADFVRAVRGTYRSSREHALHVSRVPLTKAPDRRVADMLADDCAICLKPLRGPRRLVRVRASSGDPGTCGHFFHEACVGEWELRCQLLVKQCPLCREDLGLVVGLWEDHERARPEF